MQRGALRELQARAGAVTWQQYCADAAELARLYRAADLLVHPGVQETFGLTALESQACGTPVIGIRGSYMDRIIFGDQEHWARRIPPERWPRDRGCGGRRDLRAAGGGGEAGARAYAWPLVFDRLFCIYARCGSDIAPASSATLRDRPATLTSGR